MPKAFSEHERTLIREHLMQQGYTQFSTYGLRKTSVEELATAVGISKAAFYLFFKSKEELFMDVVERAEESYRAQVLEALAAQPKDLPPRARFAATLRRAFMLYKTIPILQSFNRGDYDIIARRIPLEKIQEHTASDRQFMLDLIAACREHGIPIQRTADEIAGMMYVIFLTVLNQDVFGPGAMDATIEQLLELVAAFCLGEVDIPPAQGLSVKD